MPERGEDNMIRKSAWLLSAALVAIPNAAIAQNNDTSTKATTPSPTEQAGVTPQAQAAAQARYEGNLAAQKAPAGIGGGRLDPGG